jgi:2-polyprenyl-6-hydroxyphenyl methylase/3-demethylubiquinone-9 3-methyltransferase
MDNLSSEYNYTSSEPSWSNHYLWKPLEKIVQLERTQDQRIFEVGCGSGATANMLSSHGFSITAIDPSKSGIEQAKSAYPHIVFAEASAYEELSSQYGTFPIVVSLEVVEHVFWPRKYAKTVYDLLQPEGVAIISTPYHGYFKNLALAITGKFDSHWSPLWDGGHIKFWSQKTLRSLLEEVGFTSIEFIQVGRVPALAKSMIAVARK